MGTADLLHIVNHVARLINDPDCDHHSRDDIEDALKKRREEARYMKLIPVESRASGGTVTYTTFDAPNNLDWWDKSAVLYDYNYDSLTPETSDWKRGRWTFSTEPTRPVYILGYTYDVYATAADLLEVRASQVAEDVQSFSAAHGSFAYANKRQGPLQLAREYRRKQRPSVVQVQRSDIA